jgi:hypothetical protein
MSALNLIGIPTAQNFATIRGIDTLPSPEFYAVLALSNDAPGDAGVGFFYWDPSSSDADDDDTVLRPTDRPSSDGRWKKLGA